MWILIDFLGGYVDILHVKINTPGWVELSCKFDDWKISSWEFDEQTHIQYDFGIFNNNICFSGANEGGCFHFIFNWDDIFFLIFKKYFVHFLF